MTELSFSVKLKADGSGLVGGLRSARTEVGQLDGALTGAKGGASQLAGTMTATGGAATALAGALGGAGAAAEQMARDQRQAAQASELTKKQLREQEKEARAAAAALNRHAYGARQMGQNVADAGLQIAGGIDPIRAISQQLGQMGYAASEMGGRVGKVGAFLTGPWGIALTIGAAVLAPLVQELLDGGDAAGDFLDKAEKAATAADSFGSAQSLLGKVLDLTTGRLKTQNAVLVESIRLQATAGLLKAQDDRRASEADLARVGRPGIGDRAALASRAAPGGVIGATLGLAIGAAVPENAELAAIADRFRAGQTSIITARKEVAALKLGADEAREAMLTLIKVGTARNDETANRLVIDALDGKGVDGRLKPYERPKRDRTPARSVGAGQGEFGRDAGDRIAAIVERFDDTPGALRQANTALRQLDDLIDDLGRKRPPGFQQLVADAEAAKGKVRGGLVRALTDAFEAPRTLADRAAQAFGQAEAAMADLEARRPPGFEPLVADLRAAAGLIRDGLARPFDEFVTAQADALAVQQLATQGRYDEAEALRIIQGLERTIGRELTPARRDAVLATVQALRAEQRQTELNEAAARKYHIAVGEIRATVEDTFQAFTRGDLGNLLKTPGRLLDTFQSLKGQQLFDNLFGGAFEGLDDLIDGTAPVKDAADRMASAVDLVTAQTGRTTGALDRLERAASGAAGAVGAAGSGPLAGVSLFNGVTGPGPDGGTSAGAVEVRGRRITDPRSLFAEAATMVGRTVLGVQKDDRDSANARLAKDIGARVGTAFDGSATGGFIAGVAKSFGVNLSGPGAQIGGAIGSFLPIPGGDIIGSLAGGVLGKLFGKTKKGSATIGAVDGEAAVTGVGGNSGAYRAAASGLGGSVADALQGVVEALGGELGSFAVSIGQRKKQFVVDGSGSGRTKGGGTQSFGSEQEAVAAALRDAIGDGAVKGISDAMQRALQSNGDVERGVREALKVREVERLIAGIGGQLTQVFADFDREAEERVRVARRYGLDVVAVEKALGEQRTQLLEETLAGRVGAMKDFLDNVTYGDLFEGTAADRRKAILAEIATEKADADAGVEGAATRVTELYRQLIDTSRAAFGTAGPEFGEDRAAAIADVERLLKAEQDRVAAAADRTTAAVTRVGDLTNEGNDLLAEGNALLVRLAGLLAGGAAVAPAGGGGGIAAFDTFRNVAL